MPHRSSIRLDEADPARATSARVDRAFVRADRALRPVRTTDEGFLVVDGYAARPGVLRYGDRRELVPPETLADDEALATLRGKPVLLGHKYNADGTPKLIDTEDAKRESVGTVLDARYDGDWLFVEFTITDADAIAAARAGRLGLSPGYKVDTDENAGTDPSFGDFDAIQRRRRYNHLAIVDMGRGGSGVRARLDSDGGTMRPLILLLASLGVDTKTAEARADEVARVANAEHDATKARADAADAKATSYRDRLVALGVDPDVDVDVAKVDEERRAWHRERSRLDRLGAAHGVEKIDTLTDDALRRAVLAKARPDVKLDDVSAEYLRAAVDLLDEPKPADAERADEWRLDPTKRERADDAPPSLSHPLVDAYRKAGDDLFARR